MVLVRNVLLMLTLFLLSVRLEAQQPELMANLETYPNPGVLGSTIEYNGKIYFQAIEEDTGRELWVLDAPGGTPQLFMDIEPGPEPSHPHAFTIANGLLFFVAQTSANGRELWTTDGTVAGTVLVKDLLPGSEDANPSLLTPYPSVLMGPNDHIAFAANAAGIGREFCTSDGTSGGTTCTDLNPGLDDSNPSELLQIGLAVVFAADDGTHGTEPWVYSAFAMTHSLIEDIFPGPFSSNPREYIAFNAVGGPRLVFSANDGVHGQEPWTSKGSAVSTDIIMDIQPGGSGSNPREFVQLNTSEVLFRANAPAVGYELWRSDGLPMSASTSLVKDIRVGSQGSVPNDFAVLGGIAYFAASTATQGRELWRSDGTAAGTILLKEMYSGEEGSSPSSLQVFGSEILFVAESETYGRELYRTDGTSPGTIQVADLRSGQPGSDPYALSSFAGKAVFIADGDSQPALHFLNAANDAVENSLLIPGIGDRDSGIQSMIPLSDDLLYLVRYEDYTGTEPWYMNINTKDNNILADILPGVESSSADIVGRIGDRVFFSAEDETYGSELWVTDGTQLGTQLFLDINPGPLGSNPRKLAGDADSLLYNGRLYFAADSGATGSELWSTDGTTTGTFLVKDIEPGAVAGAPSTAAVALGEIYFRATTAAHGQELWKSDGTSGGTVLVKDMNPGAGDSNPYRFHEHDGVLFFVADNGVVGPELWKTDGSTSGTELVIDIGAGGSYPANFLSVGNTLFFTANDPLLGRPLYKIEAPYQAGNVTVVKDLDPVVNSDYVSSIHDVFGTVLFRGYTEAEGQELWTTDGTTAGTVPFKIINPGAETAAVSELMQGGDFFYFGARDSLNGYELWRTDGTEIGTTLVQDLTPGKNSSSFDFYFNHRGALYLLIETYTYGEELWRIVYDECPDDGGKTTPGQCGCGIPDSDSDLDGTLDCMESCPSDGGKLEPGVCGCGVADKDLNFNAVVDCDVNSDFRQILEDALGYTKLLGKSKKRLAKMGLTPKELKAKIRELSNLLQSYGLSGLNVSGSNSQFDRNKRKAAQGMRSATRLKSDNFSKRKRSALRKLKKVRKMLL